MPTVSRARFTSLVQEKGIFKTIKFLLDTGEYTEQEASEKLAAAFSIYWYLVKEAQQEVQRLSAVLSRTSALCNAGQKRQSFQSGWNMVARLGEESRAIDGWTISLYETDISMIRLAAPELGKSLPYSFAKSMDKLFAERIEHKDFWRKNPKLFELLF